MATSAKNLSEPSLDWKGPVKRVKIDGEVCG